MFELKLFSLEVGGNERRLKRQERQEEEEEGIGSQTSCFHSQPKLYHCHWVTLYYMIQPHIKFICKVRMNINNIENLSNSMQSMEIVRN